MDDDIAGRIRASLEEDGRLSCATAHHIARKLEVDPMEVADVATELDVSISRCQLGLFGHSPKGQGKGAVVESGMEVSDALAAAIRARLANGRLSCTAAWEVASAFKLTRLQMGSAAETLGVPISPCQLGFF
jgi:hypothetical protein